MKARAGLFVLVSAGFALFATMRSFNPSKPYPACDAGPARAALASLYDDRRLLHAVHVGVPRMMESGMSRRRCVASVRWEDGSASDVSYEFDRFGRRNEFLSMWVNINGGMGGPSF